MKNIWTVIGFTVCLVLLLAAMFFTAPRKGEVVVINCGIAEISPDFTTEMREACRKLQKVKRD